MLGASRTEEASLYFRQQVSLQSHPMRLAKSLFIGMLAGTVTTAALGALFVAFSIGATTQSYSYSDGGGGVGAEVVSINVAVPLSVGVVAAAAGFFWHWRRERRVRATGVSLRP